MIIILGEKASYVCDSLFVAEVVRLQRLGINGDTWATTLSLCTRSGSHRA